MRAFCTLSFLALSLSLGVSQRWVGYETVDRGNYVTSGGQYTFIDKEIPFQTGTLQRVVIYAAVAGAAVHLQIFRGVASTDRYQVVYSKRVLPTAVGELELDLRSENVRVESYDWLGFTNEGFVGPISYTPVDMTSYTALKTATNGGVPVVGDEVTAVISAEKKYSLKFFELPDGVTVSSTAVPVGPYFVGNLPVERRGTDMTQSVVFVDTTTSLPAGLLSRFYYYATRVNERFYLQIYEKTGTGLSDFTLRYQTLIVTPSLGKQEMDIQGLEFLVENNFRVGFTAPDRIVPIAYEVNRDSQGRHGSFGGTLATVGAPVLIGTSNNWKFSLGFDYIPEVAIGYNVTNRPYDRASGGRITYMYNQESFKEGVVSRFEFYSKRKDVSLLLQVFEERATNIYEIVYQHAYETKATGLISVDLSGFNWRVKAGQYMGYTCMDQADAIPYDNSPDATLTGYQAVVTQPLLVVGDRISLTAFTGARFSIKAYYTEFNWQSSTALPSTSPTTPTSPTTQTTSSTTSSSTTSPTTSSTTQTTTLPTTSATQTTPTTTRPNTSSSATTVPTTTPTTSDTTTTSSTSSGTTSSTTSGTTSGTTSSTTSSTTSLTTSSTTSLTTSSTTSSTTSATTSQTTAGQGSLVVVGNDAIDRGLSLTQGADFSYVDIRSPVQQGQLLSFTVYVANSGYTVYLQTWRLMDGRTYRLYNSYRFIPLTKGKHTIDVRAENIFVQDGDYLGLSNPSSIGPLSFGFLSAIGSVGGHMTNPGFAKTRRGDVVLAGLETSMIYSLRAEIFTGLSTDPSLPALPTTSATTASTIMTVGNEPVSRGSSYTSGGQFSHIDRSTYFSPGQVETFEFYVENPNNGLKLQVWRPTNLTAQLYALAYSVEYVPSTFGIHTVDVRNATMIVQSGDYLGFTNLGPVGPLSYEDNPQHQGRRSVVGVDGITMQPGSQMKFGISTTHKFSLKAVYKRIIGVTIPPIVTHQPGGATVFRIGNIAERHKNSIIPSGLTAKALLLNSAVLPNGIVIAFEAYMANLDGLTFHIWRPSTDATDRKFFLVASHRVIPDGLGRTLWLLEPSHQIIAEAGDRVGVSFDGTRSSIVHLFDPSQSPELMVTTYNSSAPTSAQVDYQFSTATPRRMSLNAWVDSNTINYTSISTPQPPVITTAAPPGFVGVPGPKGDVGPPGNFGPRGPQGDKGDLGDTGTQGPPGPLGFSGQKGRKGEAGPRGPLGQKGDLGESGPAGAVGAKGLQGSLGPKGWEGLRGPPGPNGPLGNLGPPGIKGLKGDLGQGGVSGVHGPPGINGARGPPGLLGPKGSSGNDGVPGEQGAPGAKGGRGALGPPGPMGDIDGEEDECGRSVSPCQHECVNTIGSYHCRCRDGYQPTALDPSKCQDVDECQTNNGGCQQTCLNRAGSYTCSCHSRLQLAPDAHTCIDIDECQSNPCGGSTACVNSYGNFSCVVLQDTIPGKLTIPEDGLVSEKATLGIIIWLGVLTVLLLVVLILVWARESKIKKIEKYRYEDRKEALYDLRDDPVRAYSLPRAFPAGSSSDQIEYY